MRSSRAPQTEMVFVRHGGKRRGAGRKPNGERAGVPHAARPTLTGREPVLVTLKMRKEVWNLRTRRAFARLVPTFFAARERLGMRLVEFSVQSDHAHLIVEVVSRRALSRGVQGLSVRIARALNRLMARRGKVFADRYHHRVLASPRQVRAALAYVLCNARKHRHAPAMRGWLDPFSSAPWFGGWSSITHTPTGTGAPPVSAPRTWLLGVGWRRGGVLDPDHCPGAMPA
jgi:putative transposase